jgi:ribosomal protein L11 methyltransferase
VPASPRYWELTLTVPAGAAEGLTNFLWETGALGVVEEERPGEAPELRAFFPETAAPSALAPPWVRPEPGERLALVIEPGRAFGTGHHGSTAGCLEALERVLDGSAPACAVDLGTGSGILAIALARLGVAHVLAIDEDPDAIAAATANAARNEVSARVECRAADAATLDAAPAPLVVANLITAAHRRLAPRYAGHVTPGGTLVLGGILEGEAAEVARTFVALGWAVRDTIARDGWSTLVLSRGA